MARSYIICVTRFMKIVVDVVVKKALSFFINPTLPKSHAKEGGAEGVEYGLLKNLIDGYTANESPELLIFGDSVFLRVASDDDCSMSLQEILDTHYKDDVFQVSGSGYHSGIFERFSALLSTQVGKPGIVILPINLRSFSPTWDLNPLYQFHAEIKLLSLFESRSPNYMFSGEGTPSDLDNQSVILDCKGQKLITLADFLDIISQESEPGSEVWKRRLKAIFQYHYTCPLNSMHRKLQSLKKTIKHLNKIGVAVYSYITPINYEAGLEYCGDSFVKGVEENISIIKNELKSIVPSLPDCESNLMFQLDDFSFQFSKGVFFTHHNATEHLRFEGREFIAQHIIKKVQGFKANML